MRIDNDRRRAARPSHADEQLAQALGAIANLNDNVQQLHAGIKTQNAIVRLGADVRQIVNGASCKLSSAAGRVAGYAIRETTGSGTALIRIRDGFDATGDLLLPISLAASESARDWFMPGGISYTAGLYIEVVSGSIEGVVFTGATLS